LSEETSYEIRVLPAGRRFRARAGESVLEAALRQGVALPYACRSGTCGTCKARVLRGEVDHGASPETTLSEAERRQGWALLCQARALSDLELEVPGAGATLEGFPPRRMPVRVVRKKLLAPDVVRLLLKPPQGQRLPFLAGQYVDILLPGGKRRSFSLANPPHADETLELHIRHVPGGRFTHHVLHELQEGAILRIEGPYGEFHLREDSPWPILMLAGGTGFAPLKAMLEHAFHAGIQRPMHLYWGARARRDLYLDELPRRWAREHPHFRYTPVLSAPAPEDAWEGRAGWVHEALLEDHPDLSGFEVYAAGPPAMVKAARTAFLEHGLPEERFHSDPFEFAPDSQAAEAASGPEG